MKRTTTKNTSLILPIVILVSVLLLGSVYYVIEQKKIQANDRKVKIEEQNRINESNIEEAQKNAYRNCLQAADKSYQDSLSKLTSGSDDAVKFFVSKIDNDKKSSVDTCNERLKNKSFNTMFPTSF